jgi:hypothetical protein
VTRPYAGSGLGVRQMRTVRATRPWGKRNYNLTGATCSPVTITDKDGNTRTLAPLVHGQVVRLAKRTTRAVMAGERYIAPDLTDEQQDAILAQLRANAQPIAKGFNVHDK